MTLKGAAKKAAARWGAGARAPCCPRRSSAAAERTIRRDELLAPDPRTAAVAALLPLLGPAVAVPPGVSGTVESACAPLEGAAVRLFAAGAGAPTPLGTTRTAADGPWSLEYSAPDGAELYALASGGARERVRHGAELRLLAVAGAASAVGASTTLLARRAQHGRGRLRAGPLP